MDNYRLKKWLGRVNENQTLFNYIDILCDQIFEFYQTNGLECRVSYRQMKMKLIKWIYENSRK